MNDNAQSGNKPSPQSRREQAVCDALRALLREHYLHHFGIHLRTDTPLDVALRFRVNPADAWHTGFAPPFEAQIHGQLEDLEAGWNSYRNGRIYCFRCASSDCAHAAPPGAGSVFHGYSSTGVPEWCELAQLFIESQDPRSDQLYGDPPACLARMQTGRELKQEQLSVFGRASKTYAILGQVAAGYFTVRPARLRPPGMLDHPFAVTFQIVETRNREGMPLFCLNSIPGGLDLDPWNELLTSEWRPSVAEALTAAERAVAAIDQKVKALREAGDPAAARTHLRRVPRILARLVRDLESGGRRDARRTRHAQARHNDRTRPVHKALDDARSPRATVYYDLKRETYVLCAENNRAHVFNPEGRHITSFLLRPGGAEFRVRTQRWRPADRTETDTLLNRLTESIPPPDQDRNASQAPDPH